MKNIFTWSSKHLHEILVLLLIVAFVLYIIHFAESITDKAQKIIAALAATTSTFFLFMSFRETRLGNRLKMLEFKLNHFIREIQEIGEKSKECIFTEMQLQSIRKGVSFPESIMRETTFLNFYPNLMILLSNIQRDVRYKHCIEKLGENSEAIIVDPNNVVAIGTTLDALYMVVDRITHYFFDIYLKYGEIDNSDLIEFQKENLIKMLSNHHRWFLQIQIDFENSKKSEKTDFTNPFTFKNFHYYLNQNNTATAYIRHIQDFNTMVEFYKQIKSIEKKYIKS